MLLENHGSRENHHSFQNTRKSSSIWRTTLSMFNRLSSRDGTVWFKRFQTRRNAALTLDDWWLPFAFCWLLLLPLEQKQKNNDFGMKLFCWMLLLHGGFCTESYNTPRSVQGFFGLAIFIAYSLRKSWSPSKRRAKESSFGERGRQTGTGYLNGWGSRKDI